MTTINRTRIASVRRFREDRAATHERIDREAGVIYGVRVLGAESRNGRTYSPKALDSGAKLYENVEVYCDHRKGASTPDRGLLEAVATLRGTRREGDAVFSDLHYLKTHPATPLLLERIERGYAIGLSHDAEGPTSKDGRLVEDLTHVYSVDLVTRPATNSTLFEAETPSMTRRTIKAVLEQHAKADKRAARLLEEDAMDVPVDPAMEMGLEPVAEEPTVAEDVSAAMASLIVAVLGDESLDKAAKMAKIEAILDATMDEPAAPEAPAADAEAPAEDPMVESLRKQVATLAGMVALREEVEAAGLSIALLGADKVALLKKQSGPEAQRKLLESWKPLLLSQSASAGKPVGVSGRRLQESANDYETSSKSWKSRKN